MPVQALNQLAQKGTMSKLLDMLTGSIYSAVVLLQIPGHYKKLIANLFADDTTTFLLKDNNLEKLNEILEDWCIVVGAKFNTSKTVIVLLGKVDF